MSLLLDALNRASQEKAAGLVAPAINHDALAPAQALETAQTISRAKKITISGAKFSKWLLISNISTITALALVLVGLMWSGWMPFITPRLLADSQSRSPVIVPVAAAAIVPASALAVAPAAVPAKTPEVIVDKPKQTLRAAVEPPHTPPVAALGHKPNQSQTVFQSRSSTAPALELAYSALTQGQWAQAIQGYTKALQINPQERDALLGLAYIAHQQGRVDDARAYYKQVLRQEPSHPVANSALQSLSQAQGRPDVNVQAYDVAQQHPDSATAQSALAQELVRQGRLADAQQAFERAYRLEPHTALYAFNLAVALDRLRRYELARGYYERALTLSTQMGGERVSGVSHTVLRTRLEQLQASLSAQESNDQ